MGRGCVLKRTLPTALLVVLACAPAAAAAPRAQTAAEARAEASLAGGRAAARRPRGADRPGAEAGAARARDPGSPSARGRPQACGRAAVASRRTRDAPADERYTVPELPPLCDANFCIHSVGSGDDAPGAGMAALALVEANAVRNFENGTLGWREPPGDGDGRVDIYLKEVGDARPVRLRGTGPRPGREGAALLPGDRQRLRPRSVQRRRQPRVAQGHPRPRVRARAPVRLRRAGRRLALRIERGLDGAAHVSGDRGLAALRRGPAEWRGLELADASCRSPTTSRTPTARMRSTRAPRSPTATSSSTTS